MATIIPFHISKEISSHVVKNEPSSLYYLVTLFNNLGNKYTKQAFKLKIKLDDILNSNFGADIKTIARKFKSMKRQKDDAWKKDLALLNELVFRSLRQKSDTKMIIFQDYVPPDRNIKLVIKSIKVHVGDNNNPSSLFFSITLFNNLLSNHFKQEFDCKITLKNISDSNFFPEEIKNLAQKLSNMPAQKDTSWLNDMIVLKNFVINAFQRKTGVEIILLSNN